MQQKSVLIYWEIWKLLSPNSAESGNYRCEQSGSMFLVDSLKMYSLTNKMIIACYVL